MPPKKISIGRYMPGALKKKRLRALETFEQREARLSAVRIRAAQVRSRETDEQRKSRLESDRVRTAQARSNETNQQRQARLEANRARTALARSSETDEQRQARLEANRARIAHARSSQTSKQQQSKLQTNRERNFMQIYSVVVESALNTQTKREIELVPFENLTDTMRQSFGERYLTPNVQDALLEIDSKTERESQCSNNGEKTPEIDLSIVKREEFDICRLSDSEDRQKDRDVISTIPEYPEIPLCFQNDRVVVDVTDIKKEINDDLLEASVFLKRTVVHKRNFACGVCFKIFKSRKTLDSHKMIHVSKKRKILKCDSCNYKCQFTIQLAKHILTHLGDKLFHRDECGFKTDQTRHLNTQDQIVYKPSSMSSMRV